MKTMLFQNMGGVNDGAITQQALREAAVCCSMSHPNVVATYHHEVVQVQSWASCSSSLTIADQHNGDYKLYLIQVTKQRLVSCI